MKRNILSVIGILIAMVAQAAPITSDKAARNVREFLFSSPRLMMSSPLEITNVYNGDQPYYIFNIGIDNGFVIASGDDEVSAILGFTNKGHFDPEKTPDVLKSWLDSYAQDIKMVQKRRIQQHDKVSASADKRTDVPVLLNTYWHTNPPYNRMCPDFNDGNGARLLDCNIVAMAQVMYYHRWPQYETTDVAGYSFVDEEAYGGDGTTRTMKELEPCKFKWELMPEYYTRETTDESIDAVAELMLYCGQGIQAAYLGKYTVSDVSKIPDALTNVFDYEKTAKYIQRDDYTTQKEWDDIIYRELYENRPVIYKACQEGGGMHTFVCDGYYDGFFHMNWGWGGNCDGFFKLTALDPLGTIVDGEGSVNSLDFKHAAVIGINKKDNLDYMYVNNKEVRIGDEVEVEICLNNVKETYTSLQFDMFLPEGLTISSDKDGVPEVSFVQSHSKNGDHQVSVNKVSNGSYRFVVLSPTNSCFMQYAAALLKVKLKASENMEEGNYSVQLKDINICDNNMLSVRLADAEYKVNVYVLYGDANNDARVDSADVSLIQGYITSGTEQVSKKNADVDKDSVIDVNDLMLTKDIILNNTGGERNIVETEINKEDRLSLSYSTEGVLVNLKNSTGYKALQFDLHMPEGVKLSELNADSERMPGFTILFAEKSDNVYRVLMYSAESKNILLNEGPIAHAIGDRLIENATIDSIVYTTSDLRKVSVKGGVEYTIPFGDANTDGKIDAADISLVSSYITSGEGLINKELSDVDKDSVIDVCDLVLINDIILKNADRERNIVKTDINPKDRLSLSYDKEGLLVNLTNTTCYKALQFDIHLPEDVNMDEFKADVKRLNGFETMAVSNEDGVYHVLIFSENAENVSLNEGTIALIVTDMVVEKASLKNVVFVTSDLRKAKLNDITYEIPTNIEKIAEDVSNNSIYTVNGVRVDGCTNSLQKGIFIINGKKTTLR